MASIPFVVPAFNPAARGVALDWNEKIHFGHGGQKLQKALWHESLVANGRPDIDAVVGFFRARVDGSGQSIDTQLGPPLRELDGWYLMEYLGIVICSENLEYAIHGRWHGTDVSD